MSLKAGRVGVNPNQVDPVDGSIKSSATEGYTKQEADAKFSTKDELRIAINDIDLLMGSKLNAVYGVMGENGAKNEMVKLSSFSDNGVTWTVDLDNTFSASGTAGTGGVAFVTYFNLSEIDLSKPLLFTIGDEVTYDSQTANLTLQYQITGQSTVSKIPNEILDLSGVNKSDLAFLRLNWYVPANKLPKAGKVYPMLRDARDTDSTYQPPCMTNAELTDEVKGEALSLTTTQTLKSGELNSVIRMGRIISVVFLLKT